MAPWRVCKPGHFGEEQDTDPDPHSSEKLDPDPHSREKLNPDPY
jgi:hypothetical protein